MYFINCIKIVQWLHRDIVVGTYFISENINLVDNINKDHVLCIYLLVFTQQILQ